MLPKVCIIGGGVGGLAAAQSLDGIAAVTLVSSKEYFEMPWPRVRFPVEPSLGKKAIILIEELPKVGVVEASPAQAVRDHSVELQNGKTIEFDYLIFATGTSHAAKEFSPKVASLEQRLQEHKEYNSEILAANNILVIGGGPTGCEVAGELATDLPGRQITLVHSGSSLLQSAPPRLGRLVQSRLQHLGVKVILNEHAQQHEQGWKLRGSGHAVQADKVYVCVSGTPNSEILKASHPELLDPKGFVKVNSHLQVEGKPHWFAVGDVANLPDDKLGRLAGEQGKLAAENIKIISSHQTSLKGWKKDAGMRMMAVTVGRKAAAMTVAGWSFSGFLPRWVKAKDLLVGMTRSRMGFPSLQE